MPEFQPGESLDDYFARLGAALESPPPNAPPERPMEEGGSLDEALSVPTLETILGTSVEAPEQADPDRNIVADAFSALLAVEQGEPGATPVRLPSGPAAAASDAPVITDALVDELARRVMARLAPDVVRQVVADVVSEVAERLVREEIQRVRSRQ
jgi:hypothetical protein